MSKGHALLKGYYVSEIVVKQYHSEKEKEFCELRCIPKERFKESVVSRCISRMP